MEMASTAFLLKKRPPDSVYGTTTNHIAPNSASRCVPVVPTDLPSSNHSPSEGPSSPTSSFCTNGFVSNGLSCIRTDDELLRVDDRSSSPRGSPTKEDRIEHPITDDDNSLPFVRHPLKRNNSHKLSTSDSGVESVSTTALLLLLSSSSSLSKLPPEPSIISQRLREMLTGSTLVMVNVA
eukprot:CAMPEP_0113443706 /NCGR_PEP_ID=MMETSP0014_2-20120614/2283_1 /TAXON_ID=2857 /ORGANISM="Nitzschia sp." /LENGTH=179 /DNA_ID=CAMNT_0000334683 /DNA_START=513 /DNA_END=1049 /DNA_ORIENTATION=+ /assembly_acc=CAM_ASM_000159